MSQRQKPQPIRIRVDRTGRLLGSEMGPGGCGISKCRSFPRFLHSGTGGAGGGAGGEGVGGGGEGRVSGSGAIGNAALLEVPFKTLASGLSFGGSASSMGSLGGHSSAASLDVQAPSVHADSPASASLLWCKRSESCPCLVRALQQQHQLHQDSQGQQQHHRHLLQAEDGQTRSERASPVPSRGATTAAATDREQAIKPQALQALVLPPPLPPQPPPPPPSPPPQPQEAAVENGDEEEENAASSLKRFTSGSFLNRQTRRSRRKCEEWICKLDYS